MSSPFFWIDLEMTGLDENIDSILEVAVVLTDKELKPLKEYHRIVYQPQEVIDNMNDWCKKHHGESGLTALIPTGTPLSQVEQELVELVNENYKKKDQVILCGNSISNDRKFIDKYMPLFAARLHYRQIDVSSFKEIFRRLYGVEVQKKKAHRAIDDAHESITELKEYLKHISIKK